MSAPGGGGGKGGGGVRVKVKVVRIGSGIPSFCHRGWNPASREKLPSKLEALSLYLPLIENYGNENFRNVVIFPSVAQG